MTRPRRRNRQAGFTLIEALAATVVMGIILATLATITGQWIPNWNRGFRRVEGSELISVALDRLVADIAASEYVLPGRDIKNPLFAGTETDITLVRTAVGPNTGPGLDIVRIGPVTDRQKGRMMVRARLPFAPFAPGTFSLQQIAFGSPVVLLREPFRIVFSYAGTDGAWASRWGDTPALPTAVRLAVSDAGTNQTLAISTAALIHAGAAPPIDSNSPSGPDRNGRPAGGRQPQ